MLALKVNNEYARLRAVLFGTAQSNGPIPIDENCYDPSSLTHVLAGTYPTESDMQNEMSSVMAVFHKYDVSVFRPSLIENCNQIFARDIAFVIDNKFIKSNILPDRANEYQALGTLLAEINSEHIIELPEDCHVEGGDVILCDDYIFIGVYSGSDYSDYITARTNLNAAKAIQKLFPQKIVKTFELRKSNSNPLENALHLDCCFQPLGYGKALVHDRGFLSDEDYDWLLSFFGKENVFVATAKEMSQMNCNVFSISENVVISEQNFTRLNTWLVANGFTVEEVPYAEISKQGGLLRCSTLPLNRD
ncbi:MAG: amidinotransferase [Flavobacteriaceae bacterium]|jgi:N-dimethylarginine dimethylaminohydrolase|nr:amidinotransferase [Flavobacteriaceae bacterium]MDG1384576.1 amidinotransferase [Flavobacteriaceae bacterium]